MNMSHIRYIETEIPDVTAIEALLDVAKGEVGYTEKQTNECLDDKTANAGNANYTKYARDMDAITGFYNGKKQGVAWCDVFVDWCFVQAFGVEIGRKLLCQPLKSSGAGCNSSRNYYKQKGQLHNNPEIGDQIFFWSSDNPDQAGHTGIVIDVDNKNVTTIEGNTSAGSSVVTNGGMVCEKKYSLTNSRIAGYGRPDWSLVDGGGYNVDDLNFPAVVKADKGKTVNLRKSASTMAKVLKMVPIGDTVTVLGYPDETWAKVKCDSVQGYMMREYLDPVDWQMDPAKEEKMVTITITLPKSSINVILTELEKALEEAGEG